MIKNPEVIATKHMQGVPPKGKQHQWSLTNHTEIVHMCVVCGQQTKVIWRANGICSGYMDLFQDFKGGPRMTLDRPDEASPKKVQKEGLKATQKASEPSETLEPRKDETPVLEPPIKKGKASKKGEKVAGKKATIKRVARHKLRKGEGKHDK